MRANDILLQLLGIYGQACNNYYRPIYMKESRLGLVLT